MKNFTVERALQIIAYIQERVSDSTNKMKLIKLILFADRYHVINYGYPMSNDYYVAMKQGPVPSNIFDIVKNNMAFFSSGDKQRVASVINIRNSWTVEFNIHFDDYDELSESAIESLNYAINKFGQFSATELSDISHLYPEWRKYKEEFENQSIRSQKVDFIDFFGKACVHDDDFQEYLNGIDPFFEGEDDETISLKKENFRLQSEIEHSYF